MKRIIFYFGFICLTGYISGQELTRLDSLKFQLADEKSDTGKILLLTRISHELQFNDIGEASKYAQKAFDDAKRLNYKRGLGYSITQLGNIKQTTGDLSRAEEYNTEALIIFSEVKDLKGTAICYNNLGIIAHNKNNYAQAIEFYKKSLEINNSINRRSGSATSLFCIGTVFENQAQYDSALIYYYKAQAISESIGDVSLMAYARVSLANVYYTMENYAKSLEYNEEAIRLYEKAGNNYGLLKVYISLGQTAARIDSLENAIWFYRQALKTGYIVQSQNDIANIFFSIAQVYEDKEIIDSSFINYKKALDLFVQTDNRENSSLSMISMAKILNLKSKYQEAKKLLEEAIPVAEEIHSPSALTAAYHEMAITWSYLKDFKKAFLYLNKYSDTRDSVMTVEKQEQILKLETQFETEKKEKENIILRKDQLILKSTRNSLIIGALLLIIIAVIILRSLSIKKRDNELLRQQKEEIAMQKDIVESQKVSITDSIRYAKRIQSAMLPPDELIKETVPDSFILYLPRDIVSGDYYWMKKISENKVLACVADCTGHGVPGAFMSMLGMSLLSDIINRNPDQILAGNFKPSDILNNMRSRIKESLRQSGKEGESRDGMDMALCIIETDTGKIHYSGAINSLYHVTGGVLTEIKGTRNPVGIYLNEMGFADNEVSVQKGTMIYMFSDGYYDQISSERGKFLSRNFKKMLAEISHLPSPEIKDALLKTHLDWRKDEEQVDDILVMGIRV